ncbi:MAG: SLC13 family permease [Magnetococcales bacterium]|nr:SLC13 family permease [Magnetococcales bacterium]
MNRQIWMALFFVLLAAALLQVTPSLEVSCVVVLLLLTVYLFVSEVVGVDVAAVSIMVALGLFGIIGPFLGLKKPILDPNQLFNGFSSNAVMSIIAVMIIGAGLDRTGLMARVAAFILRIGGRTEQRIIPIISFTVAFISSFMQNVGAAALFLPVVSRICVHTGLPISRLLMPMGFCAILGGTVTMVGSSPLILLNDLILSSNKVLPPEQQMHTWSLFSTTPIGLALVATGVFYFVLAGRLVLPANTGKDSTSGVNTLDFFREVYGLDYDIYEITVPPKSSLAGKSLAEVEHDESVRVIGLRDSSGVALFGAGSLSRDSKFEEGSVIALLASPQKRDAFVSHFGLQLGSSLEIFGDMLSSAHSGIAEIVIPPRSRLVGQSANDIWLRKTYGMAMVALNRQGKTMGSGEGIRQIPFMVGDTIAVHTSWKALARVGRDRDFVVITTGYPQEEVRQHKVAWAGLFFSIALGLVLFSSLKLSISLFVGALGMVLSGVLKIEEAYQAVSWKTVFLLASLIPLGLAVETTGTAAWIANQVLAALGGVPLWGLQLGIACLATMFTLVMSNVGATVLLVPLAVNIAIKAGGDPAIFALTVALATSNSFFLPTHQVNALIMGPAGYRVVDFMRAGGVMTLLFLTVLIVMMQWVL